MRCREVAGHAVGAEARGHVAYCKVACSHRAYFASGAAVATKKPPKKVENLDFDDLDDLLEEITVPEVPCGFHDDFIKL